MVCETSPSLLIDPQTAATFGYGVFIIILMSKLRNPTTKSHNSQKQTRIPR